MISLVELFGLISIAFGINAIRIAIKDQNKSQEISNWSFAHSDDQLEAFVDIPMELLEKAVDQTNGGDVDELKDKIESFKDRNRFYNL